MPQCVAHGFGVAILPVGLATDAELPVRALRFAEVDLSWTLSVASARGRPLSRAARAFLDLIPEHISRASSW